MKKLKIHSEVAYLLANVIMSFAVAMVAAADFGVSMIVAPSYILSQKIAFLTFGQAEYLVQGLLFIVLCFAMKKFKPIYLASFLTCLIYGAFLDLWRLIIPAFNPNVVPAGSQSMGLRIFFFAFGAVLTSFSVALFFKSYIYPQVNDFFVKGVTEKYKLNQGIFKTFFDLSFLIVGVGLSFLFFGKFVGIGYGTAIIAIFNGLLLSLFNKLLAKTCEFPPLIKDAPALFAL